MGNLDELSHNVAAVTHASQLKGIVSQLITHVRDLTLAVSDNAAALKTLTERAGKDEDSPGASDPVRPAKKAINTPRKPAD